MTSIPGLRIVFAGTPVFAAHHLQALVDSHHDIVAVYTQPDRPAGRGKKLTPSPVKQLAVEQSLTVYQPESLKPEKVQQQLAQHQADVMIVVAYGLLLPKAVLAIPRYGCLNVHGSLLPRWRGAAPIQRAVEAGDDVSGVTIMQMDAGLDTGAMLYKSECTLAADETSASLHDKLMALGAPALLTVLEQLQQQQLQPERQDDALANYAEKITKAEAQINWDQPASFIDRQIRAFNPFPVAYTFLDGERIKVYQAHVMDVSASAAPGTVMDLSEAGLTIACQQQALQIQQLQLPGKKPMNIADIINGYGERFAVGQRFDR